MLKLSWIFPYPARNAEMKAKNSFTVMSVEKFCNLPDHPKQRNTMRRAIKYSRPGKHLAKAHHMHMLVQAVQFKGKIYKLDGHTRAVLWKNGKLEPFSNDVSVIMHQVDNEDDFINFYDAVDNPMPPKKSTDRIYSALKLKGIIGKNLLAAEAHGLTSAMREMTPDYKHELDMVPLVTTWLPDIKALDSIKNLTTKIMPSSFITGFLMCYRYARQNKKDAASVISLFRAYTDKNNSILNEGKMNAVYALHRLRETAEKEKLLCHVRNNGWIAAKIFKIWLHYKEHGMQPCISSLPYASNITSREFLSKNCDFSDYKPPAVE